MQLDLVEQFGQSAKADLMSLSPHLGDGLRIPTSVSGEIEKQLQVWTKDARSKLVENNPYLRGLELLRFWERNRDILIDEYNWWLKSDLPSDHQTVFSECYPKETKRQSRFLVRSREDNNVDIQGRHCLNKCLQDYSNFCNQVGAPSQSHFWASKFGLNEKGTKPKPATYKRSVDLLLADWRKKYDEALNDWKLEALTALRAEFLKRIEKWLKVLSELSEQLNCIGLEPGIWLDLSEGSISMSDIETLKRWVRYLSEDKAAKEISDLLGRLNQSEQVTTIEKVKSNRWVSIPTIDVNSKEEIVGIRLGKDIEHALPSELALLSDPDTSILFDLKYLESRLMSFEMHGISYQDEQEEYEEEVSKTEEENNQGPMIICVDTSGSMSGSPENIAKAMALFLATQCQKENRACYLISFSTGIETTELTGSGGIKNVIRFLQKSFNGGTDVAPALDHSIKTLETKTYEKADVLVISDFIMGDVSTSLKKRIALQKEKGSRFFSLVIGDCFMSNSSSDYFDNEWIYNGRTQGIRSLVEFKQNVMNSRKKVK